MAAAVPKCFYYQRDHWRGSVVQDNAATETYQWDGGYFFDKAQGKAACTSRTSTSAARPADWRPTLGPTSSPSAPGGGGGVLLSGEVEADPRCAERVDSPIERRFVYYHRAPGGKVFRKRVTPIRLRTGGRS